MGYTGAYGVLTTNAFAVDATAARRAATENNFIAALYDDGSDEWEKGTNLWWPSRQAVFI
jgi:hypothetical protein